MKKEFFEGWYLKHQTGTGKNAHTLALIPSYHIDENGTGSAVLQVATENESFTVSYPARALRVSEQGFHIRCGRNLFCKSGVVLDIETKELSLHGKIYYSPFQTPRSDIMGPFAYLPNMECSHGIISFKHKICGKVTLNGNTILFKNGTGYIETDRGCSFPERYLWTQCNTFRRESKVNGVMAAAATIPVMGRSFTGCICQIYYGGRGYRIATYLGAKVITLSKKIAVIKQGKYRLIIHYLDGSPVRLKAPQRGKMRDEIRENVSCRVRYIFYRGKELLFYETAETAGFEYK